MAARDTRRHVRNSFRFRDQIHRDLCASICYNKIKIVLKKAYGKNALLVHHDCIVL